EVRLPADGPYAIEVRQRTSVQERTASAGYVQRYPAEYAPVLDTSAGARLLAAISAATGGTTLQEGAGLAASAPAAAPGASQGLWPWLLLAAAVLWPVEIAVRRGWLRGLRR
ncbi:MAG: VWA domain-containing protein, partial [Chloroflexota bacterium]